MRINDGRRRALRRPQSQKELRLNWPQLGRVFFGTWLILAVPSTTVALVIAKCGPEHIRQYIPDSDINNTVLYSGMGVSVITAWLALWGMSYCLLKKTDEEGACIKQVGPRTFLATGVLTAAGAACWWLWKKAPLNSPIPDVPKLVFWSCAAAGTASLALLLVFSCCALCCCNRAFREAFYTEGGEEGVVARPELREAFVEKPEGENPEEEGSSRKPGHYQAGSSR